MSGTAATRRSRDRQAEIAGAAARLFCEVGYHRVRIDEVAASVGMTGGAIYRHFGNKQELLGRTVLDGVAALDDSVQAPGLDDALRSLARAIVERRELGLLVQREARHADPILRAQIDARLDAVVSRLVAALRARRDELNTADAELLVRSTLAAAASISYHRVALPPVRCEALVEAMCAAIVDSSALPGELRPAEPVPVVRSVERASRREALLWAAIGLFGERGFYAVRMEDVGAAAGISGPSIYQHFSSKVDLLMAALGRGAEGLQLGLDGALAGASSAADALERVVRSYVEFAFNHPDIVGILLTEALYLPEDEMHSLRRVQHDYVAEWLNVLLPVRPDLTEPEARFLTHAVFGVANDNVRDGLRRSRPGLVDVVVRIGLDVLEGSKA